MKLLHRLSECEVLPNGLSYSWGVGSSYYDPLSISNVMDHCFTVYLRFGSIRLRWSVMWETERPRCPRCRKHVARPGVCLVCISTMPLDEAERAVKRRPLAWDMANWKEDKRVVTWGRVAGALLWLLCVWVALHIPALCNEVRYERGSCRVEIARRHWREARGVSITTSTALEVFR